MSITATANPNGTPPRVLLSVSSSNGSAITAVTLTRTSQGVTEQVRLQPAPGPSPRGVNDFEAPFDTGFYYTAVVMSGAGTETFSSPAMILSPAYPWLIHPTTPALSFVLDSGDVSKMGVVEIGAVSRDVAKTAHTILGARYRTITKTGTRLASTLQMTVATVTAAEEALIWGIVDDQTPILIRTPASYGWGFEDGYYDVGKVDDDRFMQYGPETRRVFTLPLERVATPAGTQQSVWTYSDLSVNFATYTAANAAYATYATMGTNSRK